VARVAGSMIQCTAIIPTATLLDTVAALKCTCRPRRHLHRTEEVPHSQGGLPQETCHSRMRHHTGTLSPRIGRCANIASEKGFTPQASRLTDHCELRASSGVLRLFTSLARPARPARPCCNCHANSELRVPWQLQ
jgi:hypothetical protein